MEIKVPRITSTTLQPPGQLKNGVGNRAAVLTANYFPFPSSDIPSSFSRHPDRTHAGKPSIWEHSLLSAEVRGIQRPDMAQRRMS